MADQHDEDDVAEPLPDDEPLPEEDDDDYVDYAPPTRKRKQGPVWVSALLALASAAGLGAAAYAPNAEWYTLSQGQGKRAARGPMTDVQLPTDGFGNRWITVDGKKLTADELGGAQKLLEIPQLAGKATPRGPWIMGAAIAGAVLILLGTLGAVLLRGSPGLSRGLATWVPGVGLVFVMILLVWLVAWLFKVVMFSRLLNGEEVGLQAQPALGLYVGLCGVLLAAVAVSGLSRWGLRGKWLYAFQVGGILIGAGLMAGLIRPWDAADLWDAWGDLFGPRFR